MRFFANRVGYLIVAGSLVHLILKAQKASDTLSTSQYSLLRTVVAIQMVGLLILQTSTIAIVYGERNPKEISTGAWLPLFSSFYCE